MAPASSEDSPANRGAKSRSRFQFRKLIRPATTAAAAIAMVIFCLRVRLLMSLRICSIAVSGGARSHLHAHDLLVGLYHLVLHLKEQLETQLRLLGGHGDFV